MHGTGAHDISGSLGRIREGVAQFAELQDVRVHGAQWGIAVGPKDLDVTPALPPAVASRGLGDEPTEDEVALEEWDLLVTDPLLELRLLAALPGGAGEGGVIVAADPADVVLHQRLSSLQVSPESLAAAGIDAPALAAAGAAVAASPELAEAAGAVGDPDDADLLAATARAVVATVLQPCLEAAATGPVACRGRGRPRPSSRRGPEALSPAGTKGVMRKLVGRIVTPLATRLATRVAVRRRGRLMDPTTDFVRDIAFYVKRGDKVREFIAAEVAKLAPPVVVLGHSLGGVAAVDLMSGSRRPEAVRLLVTAGSQAPYLSLVDALEILRPDGQASPYTPWLNIYSPADLLSFCASRVFVNTPGIVDEEVDGGVPFPASHSASWEQERLYRLLADHWPV